MLIRFDRFQSFYSTTQTRISISKLIRLIVVDFHYFFLAYYITALLNHSQLKTFTFIAAIIAFTLCSYSKTFSQEDLPVAHEKTKKSYWLDFGFGWGGQGGAFDLGLSYEVTPNRLISLRYSTVFTNEHCDEVVVFFPIESPLGKSAETIDLSYGILRKGKTSFLTLSAGLSYVNIETAGGSMPAGASVPGVYLSNCPADYAAESKSTVGLALRAQFIPSWRWGGVGISPYLNVNPEYTFGSITISLALGRMRPRVSKAE
jgi:hypothetical protein